ncbi:MAG: tryptophan 7-halogenase [Burkholderiales bacterium]|nr:tryptophan 7-halogenase [Burkholderiales bacterium]
MDAHCEVAVIGAGPAGCAAAIALRRAGIGSVQLLEAGDGQRPRFAESLPPDTGLVLAELGLREAFAALRCDPCVGSASSWGAEALGYNDFLFNPHGPGWHIERRRFDAFLREQAVAQGARLRMGCAFESVQAGAGGLHLQLRSPGRRAEVLHARFVIDATGQAARVARALGAQRLVHDRLVCLAALLPLAPDNHLGQRSLLEAVDHGWWYAARIAPDEALVVVATDPDLLRARGLQAPDAWHRQLLQTRHIAAAIGRPAPAPARLTVRQARSARLDRCGGPRWLAVGDAASAFDPLSSQGVHKALVDGLRAAGHAYRSLAGAGERALAEHAQALEDRFADFLRIRAHFYAQEPRWPDAPFWQRRQPRPATAPGATAPRHPREIPA